MKPRFFLYLISLFSLSGIVHGTEYFVSVNGSDTNTGNPRAPFRTLGKAASVAYSGDVITVRAGTYREWINPPRGGVSEDKRITYRAAPGEHVEIKGSERILNWQQEKNGVWKVTLPNTFFGDYNPYKDLIHGDWFDPQGHTRHTGEVFLNNKSLYETDGIDGVRNPAANTQIRDPEGSTYTWCVESDDATTTLWANFHDYDPNKELVEISTRPTCFYPSNPGVNYITIRGFHISQAATQWAAPTAEQIGIVATHWNKGWIIEDNVISNSKCSGITLGKDRGTGHNVWSQDQSIDGSLHYIEVTLRALRNGWNKNQIGSHIVRNNTIFDCEQTGICGSFGAAFSEIYDNHVYNIWTKRQFGGAEIAGIKFHAAVDTRIEHNRIHGCCRGMWLDWMTQGTRITRNLFYNNDWEDIYFEVNHGPYLVDNNIFASTNVNISDQSQGGAYVHNLFAGKFIGHTVTDRYTPYFLPHSTDVAGVSIIVNGDDRFYNNVFLSSPPPQSGDAKIAAANELNDACGLAFYKDARYPVFADGNVYFTNAISFSGETGKLALNNQPSGFELEEKGDAIFLTFFVPDNANLRTELVTTGRLGKSKLPQQAYELADGSPITFNKDYLEKTRPAQPKPGPLELSGTGQQRIRIW